jgi:LmbE family N-acetylglucosaminyl deacetylase
MRILLSPHPDDESLFAAFTILREKPLVLIVTNSEQQDIAQKREQEGRQACETLGVPVEFLGLRDGKLQESEEQLRIKLQQYVTKECDRIYAPAIEGGHKDHDALGKVASDVFENVIYYSTYWQPGIPPFGQIQIIPTPGEMEIKGKALDCYESQLANEGVKRNHFDIVRGRSEYLNTTPYPWGEGLFIDEICRRRADEKSHEDRSRS